MPDIARIYAQPRTSIYPPLILGQALILTFVQWLFRALTISWVFSPEVVIVLSVLCNYLWIDWAMNSVESEWNQWMFRHLEQARYHQASLCISLASYSVESLRDSTGRHGNRKVVRDMITYAKRMKLESLLSYPHLHTSKCPRGCRLRKKDMFILFGDEREEEMAPKFRPGANVHVGGNVSTRGKGTFDDRGPPPAEKGKDGCKKSHAGQGHSISENVEKLGAEEDMDTEDQGSDCKVHDRFKQHGICAKEKAIEASVTEVEPEPEYEEEDISELFPKPPQADKVGVRSDLRSKTIIKTGEMNDREEGFEEKTYSNATTGSSGVQLDEVSEAGPDSEEKVQKVRKASIGRSSKKNTKKIGRRKW